MQFDPHTTRVHELIFDTEADAYAAHPRVFRIIQPQFLGWWVIEGGKRTVVVNEPPPPATWRYRFATNSELTREQMDFLHDLAGTHESIWNLVCKSPVQAVLPD